MEWLLLGMLISAAVWYYFNDIYPPTHNGHKPLDPPGWWIRIWETPIPVEEIPVPETEAPTADAQ